MVTTLSPEERTLIAAVGKLVESGRPVGKTFTARALGGWLPASLPRHLRSERATGPLMDLMGVEPNARTSRRTTADLLAVISEWQALAEEQQAQELTGARELIDFQKNSPRE